MPIRPRNTQDGDGNDLLPFIALNKDAGAVIYTPFAYILVAQHVDTDGTVVSAASVAGATSVTLNVAKAGNVLVWGKGEGAAAITLS